MSDSRMVLVTGATGQQGGSVARRLLDGGFRVRGITRNTQSDAAKDLTELGAEVVHAEFSDAGVPHRSARGSGCGLRDDHAIRGRR